MRTLYSNLVLPDGELPILDLPTQIEDINYVMEVGFGIENIFDYLRVECVYRPQPVSIPVLGQWGVRAKFQFRL